MEWLERLGFRAPAYANVKGARPFSEMTSGCHAVVTQACETTRRAPVVEGRTLAYCVRRATRPAMNMATKVTQDVR